mmetsp:Transcript_10781/g.35404  ORF Transcript_10781/g.35404 Transcript_10781/m.35404 type:complete len:298 (+) Transcript_10781:363-1256(+)
MSRVVMSTKTPSSMLASGLPANETAVSGAKRPSTAELFVKKQRTAFLISLANTILLCPERPTIFEASCAASSALMLSNVGSAFVSACMSFLRTRLMSRYGSSRALRWAGEASLSNLSRGLSPPPPPSAGILPSLSSLLLSSLSSPSVSISMGLSAPPGSDGPGWSPTAWRLLPSCCFPFPFLSSSCLRFSPVPNMVTTSSTSRPFGEATSSMTASFALMPVMVSRLSPEAPASSSKGKEIKTNSSEASSDSGTASHVRLSTSGTSPPENSDRSFSTYWSFNSRTMSFRADSLTAAGR